MNKQIADQQAWSKVVQNTYGLKESVIDIDQFSFSVHSANGKSYSSAPYLTDGGIVNSKQDSSFNIDDLTANIPGYEYVLLKSRQTLKSDHPLVKVDENYVSFELDINADIDDIWTQKLTQKTRNQVRKAQKQDFDVKIGGEELINDFYSVLSQCWRDLGSPTHSKQFYQNILKEFEKSQLFVVYKQEQPIAVAITIWNDTSLFHPFAGSLKQFNSTSVNNLLYWEIIQFAVKQNLTTFDMGRSHKQQGTYRYKASWGAEPVQLYYHYFLSSPYSMPKPNDHFFYKMATKAWKYLPLWLAKALGPKLIYTVL